MHTSMKKKMHKNELPSGIFFYVILADKQNPNTDVTFLAGLITITWNGVFKSTTLIKDVSTINYCSACSR